MLAPGGANGAAVGTFTVRGDYYQAPSGVLQMGLGGIAAGQYDVLAVTGIGGVWVAVFAGALRSVPLLPLHDPNAAPHKAI